MTYLARHVVFGCEVAVKVVHAERAADPATLGRFEHEIALGSRLVDDALVGVLDAGTLADGRRYLVMELARGETLAAMLANGSICIDRALRILGEVLRGLSQAHGRGVSLRGIALDSIVVDGERVKVLASAYRDPDARAELFAVGVVASALLATHGVADREVKSFVDCLIRRRYASADAALVALAQIGDPDAVPDLTAA